MASAIANLPPALNPFKEFPNYINDLLRQLALLQQEMNKLTLPNQTINPNSILNPNVIGNINYVVPIPAAPAYATGVTPTPMSYMNFGNEPIVVNIQVEGSVVSNTDLTDYIRSSLLDSSASGSFASIGTNGRVRDY